jgi:hypothetical protein
VRLPRRGVFHDHNQLELLINDIGRRRTALLQQRRDLDEYLAELDESGRLDHQ